MLATRCDRRHRLPSGSWQFLTRGTTMVTILFVRTILLPTASATPKCTHSPLQSSCDSPCSTLPSGCEPRNLKSTILGQCGTSTNSVTTGNSMFLPDSEQGYTADLNFSPEILFVVPKNGILASQPPSSHLPFSSPPYSKSHPLAS